MNQYASYAHAPEMANEYQREIESQDQFQAAHQLYRNDYSDQNTAYCDDEHIQTQISERADPDFKLKNNFGYASPLHQRQQIEVYGSKYAFQFKPAVTKGGVFTVLIESAPKKNTGEKAFDWGRKISIQLTMDELISIIGVLCWGEKKCEFALRGDELKGFSVEHQSNNGRSNIFITAQAKGKGKTAAPMPHEKGIAVASMALVQYCANFPTLSTDAAMTIIRDTFKFKKNI